MRDIAVECVVCGSLVSDYVRNHATLQDFRQCVRRVGLERDRSRDATPTPGINFVQRVIHVCRGFIDVLRRESSRDAIAIDFHHQRRPAIHRRRERLSAAHATQACGQHETALEAAAEVTTGRGGECLIGALQNSLCSDVNPASRGHLPVHREAAIFQVPERFPGCPGWHEQRVRNQDARCVRMRPEHTNRLT